MVVMPHLDSLESSTSVQSNRCRILRFRGNPRKGCRNLLTSPVCSTCRGRCRCNSWCSPPGALPSECWSLWNAPYILWGCDILSLGSCKKEVERKVRENPYELQGTSKIAFPASVNIMRNNCVFLPAVGTQRQLFHIIFTEPREGFLEDPCIS